MIKTADITVKMKLKHIIANQTYNLNYPVLQTTYPATSLLTIYNTFSERSNISIYQYTNLAEDNGTDFLFN